MSDKIIKLGGTFGLWPETVQPTIDAAFTLSNGDAGWELEVFGSTDFEVTSIGVGGYHIGSVGKIGGFLGGIFSNDEAIKSHIFGGATVGVGFAASEEIKLAAESSFVLSYSEANHPEGHRYDTENCSGGLYGGDVVEGGCVARPAPTFTGVGTVPNDGGMSLGINLALKSEFALSEHLFLELTAGISILQEGFSLGALFGYSFP